MPDFLLGFLSGATIFIVGFVMGRHTNQSEDQAQRRRERLKRAGRYVRNLGQKSGSVQPKEITHAEAAAEDRKTFTDRFRDLGGNPQGSDKDFFQP